MLLVLGTDLFFTSRITEVARTLGVPHATARTVDGALDRARRAAPGLVIVDLVLRDADGPAALLVLRSEPALASARIVAFAPHVMEELFDAARGAGADAVLTRGQLSKQLPDLLAPLVPTPPAP